MLKLEEYKKLVDNVLNKLIFNNEYLNLILGTTAVESDFGTIRRQHGFSKDSKAGAFGVNQIELATHDWIVNEWAFVIKNKEIKSLINKELYDTDKSLIENLMYNDSYNIAICALKYKSCSHLFDFPDDLNDYYSLARIWKKFYNTKLGCGKEEDFINKYKKYINDNLYNLNESLEEIIK